MSSPVGNPGGLLVSLRNGGTAPGTNIFDLTGVNPTTDGIYGYSTPSLYLAPLTIYWVVLTAESPSSGGYHRWNIPQALSGPAYDTLDGWQANGYLGSVNGLNWFGERPSPFQYAVVATAVPEPATGVMLIVAVLAILIARSLAKPKSTTHLSSASETGQSGVLTLTGT